MASLTISTRIDSKIAKKLDTLSRATKRSKSFLAAEAIEKYIDDQTWQIDAIKKGIKEADDGNFASESEVREKFSKWGVHAD
jgi:RHH-type transcriptional regulator, rel operon repressor / antitoxin RelB